MTQEELRSIVDGIAALPTLPEVANKLVGLLSDPDASVDEIVETISKDPATAAKVLRLTNSAYYGLPRSVANIRHAVLLLGMRTTRNLALGLSVVKVFGKDGKRGGVDYRLFWRHSVGAAYVCRMLGERVGDGDVEMLFLVGLLHDIGKLVIAHHAPDVMMGVISKAKAEGIRIFEAEKAVFDTTDAEVGAWLCERWRLPARLIEAIRLRDSGKAAEGNVGVAVCKLADYVCSVKGAGCLAEVEEPRVDKEVWSALHMDAGRLKELLGAVDAELEAADVFMQQV